MNYEEKIKSLTPERKLELWNQVKDTSFSNKTRYMMIYYKALKLWYLTK